MDPISAFLSGPDKSDAAGSFLHSPDSTTDFLTAPESVDEIHQRVASMPSPQYSYEDAKRIYENQQSTPLSEDVANAGAAAIKAVPAIVGDLGANIGKGAAEAYGAYADQGRSAAEVAAGLGLSTAEGVARQALDLGHAVQRGHQKASDAAVKANIQRLRMQMAASQPEGAPAPPTPTVDPVAQLQKRLNDNAQWSRMRQDMAEGKQGGWIDPAGSLTKNGMLYPGVSEVAATVVDPTMLVPGGAAVKAATTVGEKAVQGAIARAAGEGALTQAAEKVGSFAGKTANAVTVPAKLLKKTVDAALPETGLGTIAAAGPATAGATVAGPARVIEKGAEVVGQLGRTSGGSSASRLTQLAMSETAPPWIRGAARHMARIGVDKGAAFAGDLVKSGATGAAVGGAIAAPGAENAEEVGGALGSGFGLGTLTHALLSPAIEGVKHRAAQDFDVLRWYENKSPEEQSAISSMNLSRDEAIKQMVNETIANGYLDPNSNVHFEYQPPAVFEPVHGKQRAVAFVESDRPTIIFNTGKMKTGTAYHELFHILSRSPQIVDYGALTTKLLGVTDAAGNVVQPGLLGKADVSRLGDVYFSRLDPIGQKSVETEKAAYDADPNSPEGAAWTKRIVNEIGAELFANLARDTKGSLLEAIDKPTLKLVDSMTRGDRSQWVQNWGARLQQVLGAAPNAESDIFPGLKASPEIQSMLRDFVRAKRNLTKTPEFNEDNAEVHVVVNPRDAFRPGGDEIVKKFPDNDNFAKDATGQPVYAGGRPVLLTESEIKKVQTNRAKEMSKVLESLPDTGEAGVMRPTAPVPVAPAPTPALPPGAVPATPKATRPVTKGTSAFTGKHFSDAQIAALEKLPDSVLTPSMKAKLKTLNDLAKQGDGSPILLFYNAALKNRRYSSAIRETARVITPIAMSITKAGNFTVTGLDITAFNSKLQRWFADKPRAFDDFNNSPDFFIEKTQQYLENHKTGQPGATGLDADAARALRMRNRIQDFLNIRDIASESLNPDRLSKATDKDGLIRAFRFDRMNRVEPARGDKFPIDYEMVKRNYSPQGEKDANEEVQRYSWGPDKTGLRHGSSEPDKLAAASAKQTRESGQYSQLERIIDQKVQGDSIPAAQLAAMLRNPQSGVKADEIKWTGLDDFLKGKGRVTKQELLDFVRANRLQIEEKRLGEATQESAAKWTQEGDSFTYETLDKHLGQITLAEENNLRPLEGWEKYSVTVPGHGHRYFETLQAAKQFAEDRYLNLGDQFPVHRLEITDAMRQDIKTKGQPLFSPDVTETPAFKNWFGESKVVDSEGKPVVVYHGTGEKFTRFSKNKSTQGIFWFTNDKSSIEKGEAGAQGKGRTLDLFASIKNPAGWDEYHKYGLVELKSLGYDGAILPENDGTFTGFVFEPTQLKSASRNRGGFDPQNTSILMSPNVTAEQVRDLPADQFATESKTWKGGLTGQAIELGKTLKPEDLPKLQSYLDESRAKAQQIRKSGDLQGAMVEALRGQFFREASEAYRASQGEEGLSIRPQDLKTTPIGVKSEGDKVVDNQANPDSIGGMVKKMFSPDEVQFKRVKPLPNSVGDENVPIVHFSGQHGLKKLDPAYMGKGMANSRDRRGGPKSFFFVAESPLGADEQFFGQGKVAYGAVVSGTRLYDLRVGKPDPLGFSRAMNPLEAEETLASKGYAGVLVEGGKDDPRKTVILFKRAEVKEIPVKGPVTKAPRVDFPIEKGVDKPAPMVSPEGMIKGVKRALSILAADGNGVTLNLATGRNMAKAKAYAVSIFPERSLVLDTAPKRSDLEDFITKNRDLLSQPENALGIWHDKQSGKYYVDVSVAVEDPAFAKYLGKKYNQKAIWDFQKMSEIPTGGTGDAVENAPAPNERVPRARQEFKTVGI